MRFTVDYAGRTAQFDTKSGLFSPTAPDRGTLAMLSTVEFRPNMRVLDLGCGWGMVGIFAALLCGGENVAMCDCDAQAIAATRINLEKNGIRGVRLYVSDGVEQVEESGFDMILSNPPYQSDFAVAKRFIEKGFNRLNIGGQFLMVTKRKEWYKRKLIGIFGGAQIREIDGYFVFMAEKRQQSYASKRP